MVNCSENLRNAGTVASERSETGLSLASALHFIVYGGAIRLMVNCPCIPFRNGDAGQFRDEGADIHGNGLARGAGRGMVILDHTFQRQCRGGVNPFYAFIQVCGEVLEYQQVGKTGHSRHQRWRVQHDFPALIGVKTVRKGFAQRGKRFFRREECLQNTIHELRFALFAKGLGR